MVGLPVSSSGVLSFSVGCLCMWKSVGWCAFVWFACALVNSGCVVFGVE